SYAQVKKITKSFTDGVGKGGFGIVYKGVLHDGRKVAVKVLKDSKRNNGEDFINEVASMSKTSHVNIVTLLGFCYEGSKRAIIYEFMEKGSLDKYMSSDIDRSALYGIALGVARGLEYLHNGCRERIVHFDIKPQNILLDDNLCPKVSDFGLAKLCENKESIMSLLDTRGTIGYIAPEVFSRMYGRVSHKSDVYSYGMLVLEMIGARNKKTPEDSTSNESSMYFPEWIYKDLEKGYNKRLIENGISSGEDKIVRKMTLVGLWCIQSSPSIRPSMNKVVEMMEGSGDALEVPPKPVLPQIPAAPLVESSWISEENSSPSEQYSYSQVKRITKSFSEVVGRGGFGTVYRGTLPDDRKVAVKILKNSKGYSGEDFINEVASISQTSHINIVTLLGFCFEGSKRAILYEFLENGSLDKLISSKRPSIMDCRDLYGIALGVARGLEYLHHGCRTRIVHFDIKPQNVLLDHNLCPKVSDFGLAKLCEKKESILSLLDTRGTIGYIAPELFSRMYGRVSHKSDVYSYGMLVLEMIGARNKDRDAQEVGTSTSSMYFPEWIYKDLEMRGSGSLMENGVSSEEEEMVRKMTLVGLWCIQSSPSDRPPMNRVVEMMEGSVDALEVPPRPVFQIPAEPLLESSTISENISGYTQVCSMNVA
ncbi:unnamed protein product, partial [Brassica oleracea]